MSDYIDTIKTLRALDDKQLLELMHDLEDTTAIDRIRQAASVYLMEDAA